MSHRPTTPVLQCMCLCSFWHILKVHGFVHSSLLKHFIIDYHCKSWEGMLFFLERLIGFSL